MQKHFYEVLLPTVYKTIELTYFPVNYEVSQTTSSL